MKTKTEATFDALLEAAKGIINSINEEQKRKGLINYTEGFVVAFDDLEKAIAAAEKPL